MSDTLRKKMQRMKDAGYSAKEIGEVMGLRESTIRGLVDFEDISEEEVIWYPGVYVGRRWDYAQKISDISVDAAIALVRRRAKEDGEWCIKNWPEQDEAQMRRWMEYVSDENHIMPCISLIGDSDREKTTTVDWVCRRLANHSKLILR